MNNFQESLNELELNYQNQFNYQSKPESWAQIQNIAQSTTNFCLNSYIFYFIIY
jgi:hypothetical protein